LIIGSAVRFADLNFFMDQPVKSVIRTRRTRQQIESLIAGFSQSGLTVKEYCLSHGISQGVFHKWKARFKKEKFRKTGEPAFASMKICTSSFNTLFAEVGSIRIYQPVTAAYLKELLA
jgi:hypothetical protein